ncbi:valacyclovir hydrolase, putative [Talaromyces stipitatus ATCC 10500]|uniref:Valacyclovir hydrolase, putative n=1 Tax=Talaromyces stipitatus (strain ATCC 10500 / CBS 375.48 / QM 6759 / NRRL 1006) TaxID=441959 RepID=B8MST3_TALSN|nr:valacyclovir hydrolase, putative [Talaromyces stipitatus ATCC 10500]EED12615.1 valacyclovir hydrolase, putative [Talaromyces stipitatus ATCC 10500]
MPQQFQQFQLPDGRNLDYCVNGPEDGIPLVWLHGTPSAGIPAPNLVTACAKKGIKVIALSRPGYGGSSRNKGRQVVDTVADIKSLLNHLGVKKCLVGGWSGGGPLTLACAARLPTCLAAVSFAGVGPYGVEGLDWWVGQGEDNVEEFSQALKGEPQLRQFCESHRKEFLQSDLDGVMEAMSTLLPPCDNATLIQNRDTIGQNMIDMLQEGLKHNADGWVDDDLELLKPWGFELSEIRVPVVLLQGTEDKMVPFGHGKWLAEHLPQDKVKAHLLEGHGHISIFEGIDRIIDELIAVANL